MNNFIKEGKTIDYPVVGTPVASGEVVAIGDVVGVAIAGGATGETIAVAVTGVYGLPKGVGALAQGAKAYLNVTAEGVKTITGTDVGNTFVGYVWSSALSTVRTVAVKLQG